MTMPHLMNCSHSEDGWCLGCVKDLWESHQRVANESIDHGAEKFLLKQEANALKAILDELHALLDCVQSDGIISGLDEICPQTTLGQVLYELMLHNPLPEPSPSRPKWEEAVNNIHGHYEGNVTVKSASSASWGWACPYEELKSYVAERIRELVAPLQQENERLRKQVDGNEEELVQLRMENSRLNRQIADREKRLEDDVERLVQEVTKFDGVKRELCPVCGEDFAEFPDSRHSLGDCPGPECTCYEVIGGHQMGCPHYKVSKAETEKMNVDIIGGFPYAEPNCKGCGKPLTIENAWMADGCPCNSELGINSMNETRWRLLMQLQQRQSRQIESLREENERLKREHIELLKAAQRCSESIRNGVEFSVYRTGYEPIAETIKAADFIASKSVPEHNEAKATVDAFERACEENAPTNSPLTESLRSEGKLNQESPVDRDLDALVEASHISEINSESVGAEAEADHFLCPKCGKYYVSPTVVCYGCGHLPEAKAEPEKCGRCSSINHYTEDCPHGVAKDRSTPFPAPAEPAMPTPRRFRCKQDGWEYSGVEMGEVRVLYSTGGLCGVFLWDNGLWVSKDCSHSLALPAMEDRFTDLEFLPEPAVFKVKRKSTGDVYFAIEWPNGRFGVHQWDCDLTSGQFDQEFTQQ